MPTKPTPTSDGGIKSQKDRRYYDTFFDQHKSIRFPAGRPWWGVREFLSGSVNPSLLDPFVQGELGKGNHEMPGEEWDAPWVPEWNGRSDRAFYEFDYPRRRIRIRYDRILANDREAQDKYYLAGAKVAAANGWAEVRFGVMPTFQVVSVIGSPPRSPKIAQAAQAGDPWLLGLIDEPNDELAALLGITTNGMRAAPIVPPRPEVVSQVLDANKDDLAKMIAAIVTATLDARDSAKDAANKTKMAKARSARRQDKRSHPEAGPVGA